MKIILAAIIPRRSRSKNDSAERMVNDYTERAGRYTPLQSQVFETERDLILWTQERVGRVGPFLILFDGSGKALSSEQFAALLERHKDGGTQRLVLAVGPADGWSPEARARADLLLSLGAITLPHHLARIVVAEQAYRALTILAGHPYHSGH